MRYIWVKCCLILHFGLPAMSTSFYTFYRNEQLPFKRNQPVTDFGSPSKHAASTRGTGSVRKEKFVC